MVSKSERQRILERGSNPDHHSLSQRVLKYERDRGKKAFGKMDKAVRAQSRREEKQQLLEDEQLGMEFLPERNEMQFYRALNRILEEKATPEDVQYIESLERPVEHYITDKGNNVTTTIIDFTPLNSKNLS